MEEEALGNMGSEMLEEERDLEDALFCVESPESKSGIVGGTKEDSLGGVSIEAKPSNNGRSNNFVKMLKVGEGVRDGL